MEIAVLTMVHNEADHLRAWIKYYEPLAGRENLYIIAHGGDENIVQIALGCRVIYLPRKKVDWRFDTLRMRVINAYAAYLINNYDCVVSGDVDELVFADPDVAPTLRDFIQLGHKEKVLTTFGFHLMCDGSEDGYNPLLVPTAQRNLAILDGHYCKPLICFAEPEWTKGFHSCMHGFSMPVGLYMAHTRCASLEIERSVAEGRKESVGGFDNLGSTHLQRFWERHDLVCVRRRRALQKSTIYELDDVIDMLRSDLRDGFTNGRFAERAIFSPGQIRAIRLPERFRRVAAA